MIPMIEASFKEKNLLCRKFMFGERTDKIGTQRESWRECSVTSLGEISLLWHNLYKLWPF